MTDKVNRKCKVCDGDVSGAHKCMECQESVHLVCGKGVGDEGYGQSVVCNICQERDKSVIEITDQEQKAAIEVPERLWKMFPENGNYIKEIIKFSGYTDVYGILELRKEEKRKEMFEFAIDMVDQIPDRRKIFGIFEKIPEKVRILPGLNFMFNSFLNECEKVSKKQSEIPVPEEESKQRESKRVKRKDPTQNSLQPSSSKRRNAIETIDMVKLRLDSWMKKQKFDHLQYTITEADEVKCFECLNCKRKINLGRNDDGNSVLSNVHRHFKKDECSKFKIKGSVKNFESYFKTT